MQPCAYSFIARATKYFCEDIDTPLLNKSQWHLMQQNASYIKSFFAAVFWSAFVGVWPLGQKEMSEVHLSTKLFFFSLH